MRPNWSGALAGLTDPLTTVGGVNCVVGVRPSLWRGVAPDDTPADAADWTDDLVGPDGFTMPATPHDAWVWLSGGDRTAIFDNARAVLAATASVARLGREVTGWLYRHDRDLTGFIDGTENPPLLDAQDVAVLPQDGSSVLLFQKWVHHPDWRDLSDSEQEKVIGRTKPDSVQLDDDVMPDDSHVSRTVVEENGEELHIFRRNVGYGGPTDHGTVFVGFCATQHPLDLMLRRMAGADGGIRDALTRYTAPVSGSYYVIPSVDALTRFVAAEA